jgi:transcription antitermination factor NusG
LSKSIDSNSENERKAILQWFALRVKSRCEKVATVAVQSKGYEAFLPLQVRKQRWSDRVKAVELPLFPGYIFCRADVERRLPLLTIPGVLHFVGNSRAPLPIDDREIVALEFAAKVPMDPCDFLESGKRVRLDRGPLAGMEGFLVEGQEPRMVVSITALKRSAAVGIERPWVELTEGDACAATSSI